MRDDRRIMGGGAAVMLVVLLPLWAEFHEPANMGWNIFLAALLIGVLVAAFLLHSYLKDHIGEVGEARFDTRNKHNG